MGYLKLLQQVEKLKTKKDNLGCWRVSGNVGLNSIMSDCQGYDRCESLMKGSTCSIGMTLMA